MGYINELFVLLLEVGYLADALWVCSVLGVSKGSVAGEKRHKTGQEDHISTAGWPLGLFFVGYINELFCFGCV